MAPNPDQHTEPSLDDGVQNHTAPDEGGTNTEKPITAQEEEERSCFNHWKPLEPSVEKPWRDAGDKKRTTEDAPPKAQNHQDSSNQTAIKAPPPSVQTGGGSGMSSPHLYSNSPYIGQAQGNSFVSNEMAPPGSIAQNSSGGYSAAQASAAGHAIGEADITAVSSMGSNAAVSRQLGISQMGSSGPYGTYAMGGSSGQFTGGYHPSSSGKMAMPGEIMGTVTLPIYNMSPYPVPVTGSSQAGQGQHHGQQEAHFYNAGVPVGETEWHRSDGGEHNTHYMREGSTANTYGNILLSHKDRQPLSEENALAIQRQEESLLAAQMAHSHLHGDDVGHDDVGRTDSKRGLRGAMAPKRANSSGAQQDMESVAPSEKRQKLSGPMQSSPNQSMKLSFGMAESSGKRSYMQDRHILLEQLKPDSGTDWAASVDSSLLPSLAAVFDGHKRCEPADLCSKRLHVLLSKERAVFQASDKPAAENTELHEALKCTFKALDEEIIQAALASDVKECHFGGTTALMALISDRKLYVAHTGDSGALMACTASELEFPLRLTTDHKPNRPDERERIEKSGGLVDERRNRVVSTPKKETNRVTMLNMSRALGDPQFKLGKEKNPVDCTPEVRAVELNPGDNAIVLATDGLWDVLSDVLVVELLVEARGQGKSSNAAGKAAKMLVDEALRNNTGDNVTALVIWIDWD